MMTKAKMWQPQGLDFVGMKYAFSVLLMYSLKNKEISFLCWSVDIASRKNLRVCMSVCICINTCTKTSDSLDL